MSSRDVYARFFIGIRIRDDKIKKIGKKSEKKNQKVTKKVKNSKNLIHNFLSDLSLEGGGGGGSVIIATEKPHFLCGHVGSHLITSALNPCLPLYKNCCFSHICRCSRPAGRHVETSLFYQWCLEKYLSWEYFHQENCIPENCWLEKFQPGKLSTEVRHCPRQYTSVVSMGEQRGTPLPKTVH